MGLHSGVPFQQTSNGRHGGAMTTDNGDSTVKLSEQHIGATVLYYNTGARLPCPAIITDLCTCGCAVATLEVVTDVNPYRERCPEVQYSTEHSDDKPRWCFRKLTPEENGE